MPEPRSEHTTSSYCPSGGTDCWLLGDTPGEPCWGDVEVVDEFCTEDFEDCWWTYACQGHAYTHDGGDRYIPEPDANSPA